uniref:Uncharacterized protein n=1 Tax=Arundo donax TaxID=35708 RepID=A0A0A8Y4T5_ARUDO
MLLVYCIHINYRFIFMHTISRHVLVYDSIYLCQLSSNCVQWSN